MQVDDFAAPRVRRTTTPAQRLSIGGVLIDALSEREIADLVAGAWASGVGGWIVTVNVDILRRIKSDSRFKTLIAPASLKVADGMPLVWASYLSGTPLPERVAGADLFWTLSERAAAHGRKVALIGGEKGAARGAADVLRRKCPGINIVAVEPAPRDEVDSEAGLAALASRLADAGPELVFVALGCPKQDVIITRLRPQLPSAWFIGVGIALGFAAGEVARAPRVLRRCGLEWLHRLTQEPRRLGRRYLVDIPVAVGLLLSSLSQRLVYRTRG